MRMKEAFMRHHPNRCAVLAVVGLSPGGGYDLNARLVAKHIGRYIPGQPQVIVRNMPGGGGLVMTNFVANVSAKDGLHIGAPQRGVPFEPLLGDASHAKFEPAKLQWIGSANADTSVAVATRRSGVKTWQDLKTKELIVAGTGIGTESVTVPYVLRNILGLQFKVIAGFGGSEMNLAMMRGEVDGRGTFTWTSLKPHYKEWADRRGLDPVSAGAAQTPRNSWRTAGHGARRNHGSEEAA
jgi:tripartite-type tricarboxylate transporter receptor subunit TctC